MESVLQRARLRLNDQPDLKSELVEDLARSAVDRINLRLGTELLPRVMESIAVDVTVKLYRRHYHEGITLEAVGGLSTQFVEDILAEYDREFSAYQKAKKAEADASAGRKVVRFI